MNVAWAAQLVFIFVLAALLLNKYTNWRRKNLILLVPTLLGWYFSFLIVLMLPLDISIVRAFLFLKDLQYLTSKKYSYRNKML